MAQPDVTTEPGRAGLAALVARPAGALVVLDFDGTLAPIVERPEDARAHQDVLPALQALGPRVGRLAVLTGRPALVAAEYAGLRAASGLGSVVVLGQYGRERWDAATDELVAPPPPEGLATARPRLGALAEEVGAYLEDKGAAVAVHTRRAPDPAGAYAALHDRVRDVAEAAGLAFEPGKLVLEVRPPGIDKGVALRALAAEDGNPSAVVFAGDDLGDLAAYEEVGRLRAAGVPGVLVCSGGPDAPDELVARADALVDGPEGVARWLRTLADALSG